MSETTNEASKTDEIEGEVLADPWATHQEIADRVETSRPYVSEVLADRPDLKAVRDAFRNGIDVDPGSPLGWQVLFAFMEAPETVEAERETLREVGKAIRDGRAQTIRIELLPEDPDDE